MLWQLSAQTRCFLRHTIYTRLHYTIINNKSRDKLRPSFVLIKTPQVDIDVKYLTVPTNEHFSIKLLNALWLD